MDETTWKILLIDDDEDDYLLTRTMLAEAQGRKFQLDWAGTFDKGRQALGLGESAADDLPAAKDLPAAAKDLPAAKDAPTRAGPYQAVLVDYDLGLKSGIELIREAAAADYPAPLILLTGRGSYTVDLEAMQAGATLYLTKSEANPLLLERAIRYAVEMKNKTAALVQHAGDLRAREAEVREHEAALKEQEWQLHQSEAELRQSAAELRAREALLDSVMESAQGAVWAIDRDYRLTMANADFAREAEESLGREIPLGESMLAGWVTQHKPGIWRKLYDRVLRGETVRHELTSPAMSGKMITREYTFYPIFDADGQVTGAACFARDITETRPAQVELADFLESTHDTFFALDSDWRIIYANRRWAELLGRDAGELVGQNFWEAFPRYLGTEVEQRYREAMDKRVPVHFEAGGFYSTQWYNISIYPTRSGISVFASDLSKEKQAMRALREREAQLSRSESRYRAFFENLSDLVQVMELVYDDQGAVVDWVWRDANQPALDVLQMKREDVIGSKATERLGVEFVYRLLPGYARVVETGEPLNYEINFAGRDFMVSVFHMEGHQIGSSATDITYRKETERSLRESEARLRERNVALRISEQRLRRLFDSSIIGIMNRDLAGNIFDANQAFLNLLGYTREAFLSVPRNINDLIPEAYQPVEAQIVAEVLATGASRPHEKELICADGRRIPVLVGHTLLEGNIGGQGPSQQALNAQASSQEAFTPLRSKAGPPLPGGEGKQDGGWKGKDGGEIIGFVVDLTELKAAQQALEEYAEKLKRSNQELEQFAFIASHDLQEPLRKIQSFGELIERDLGGKLEGHTADYLERMRAAAQRMQDMIHDLLELSRVSTRGQPFVQVDLNETASEVVSDLEDLIERTGGEVQVEPLPKIEADPLQMRQLLQNLIGNALKFHKPEEPPRVVVTASGGKSGRNGSDGKHGRGAGLLRDEAMVSLVIEDNGIGFEKEYFERILEPFQRLHSRSEYEGTGIGLAICKQIVHRHHGQMAAESAPGAGAKFIITLPVRQEGEG